MNPRENHYSNCLMISLSGKPLSLVGEERIEWYLKRNLAEEIFNYDSKYTRVIKLKFENKGLERIRDSDLTIMQNICVVCGSTENLQLHHVVPYRVKRYYPDKYKEHTRHQCVLLCNEHHKIADELTKQVNLTEPHISFNNFINESVRIFRKFTLPFLKLYIKLWIMKNGGVKNINKRYLDKFKTMQPKFLPETWANE